MKRLLLLFFCTLLLFSCNREKPVSTKLGMTQAVILSTKVAPNSAFNIAIGFDPSPPRMSSKTKVRLKLAEPTGAAVSAARVNVSLVMPLMDMGKNELQLQSVGNGNYEGTGQFTMSGEWEVVCSATANGKSGKTTFNVRVED